MRAHGGQTRGGAWDEEADTFRLTLYTTITHSGVPARQRTRVQQRRIKQEAARPPAPTRQARGCCAPGGARRSGRCPAVRVPAAAPDEHCRTCRTSCAHLLRSGPLRRSRIDPRRLSRNTAIPCLSLTGSAATRKAPSTWSRNSGHRTVRSTYRPPHPDTITKRVKGPRHSAHGAGPQGHATRTHAPPPARHACGTRAHAQRPPAYRTLAPREGRRSSCSPWARTPARAHIQTHMHTHPHSASTREQRQQHREQLVPARERGLVWPRGKLHGARGAWTTHPDLLELLLRPTHEQLQRDEQHRGARRDVP
jgi:hypothetical protein